MDLVKAYERIPQWVLVREAEQHGYPILVIRLSVAVCYLLGVTRVDEAVSQAIQAFRGIAAGQAKPPQRYVSS